VSRYTEVAYTDELLADGSVHRRFSDGRQEWRRRGPGPVVLWTDHNGNAGTDEQLGGRIVKRTFGNGQVHYGREQGYGRTAWPYGRLTVNRTSFGGRMGAILAAAGGGLLLGAIVDPPMTLTPLEEEQLRQQAQAQAQQSSSSSGDGGGEWEAGGDDFDDDFG
jgi:hypothetical protein